MQIGIGAWRWVQHYAKQGQQLDNHYDEALESVKAAGATSFEPFLPTEPADQARLAEALARHGFAMPSAYRNVRLHEPDAATRFAEVLSAARWAKTHGATHLTLNAEPIAWGKPLDKDDSQLRFQSAALCLLCEQLADEGLRVAYHVHDAELRQGARELHAMLTSVPASLMGFCFDPHWVYRGCGNSQVATETIADLYAERIEILHLRQSEGGVFTESFQSEGDLDYTFLTPLLGTLPTYIEQGWETGTPDTLPRAESDRRSIAAARALSTFASES